MKLSTRGRYGVLAMFDIAMYGGEDPVSINTIAEREGLSESYLEQLMGHLRRAGLVTSTRGAGGGYRLVKPAESISVGDIIRVLEGPIAPVDCVAKNLPEDFEHCANTNACVTRKVWARLRDSMVGVLDSISLADLMADSEAAVEAHAEAKTEDL